MVHDVQAIQEVIGNMKTHSMTLHAITLHLLFLANKKEGIFTKKNGLDILDAFESSISSKEDIVNAGERFLLKLHGARTADILDKLYYKFYNRSAVEHRRHVRTS